MAVHRVAIELLEEALKKGNKVTFSAQGDSMLPLIRTGDPLHVIPCQPTQIKKGDIVVLKRPQGILIHRVHRIEGHSDSTCLQLITKGDALTGFDRAAEKRALIGKVAACGNHPLQRLRWRILNSWVIFWTLSIFDAYEQLSQKETYRRLASLKRKYLTKKSLMAGFLKRLSSYAKKAGLKFF